MPRPVCITYDSTCDLTPALLERFQIRTVPLTIQTGERIFPDDGHYTSEDLYADFHRDGTLPKTAAVSPEQFKEFFGAILAEGFDIVHIDISADLSGTCQNALIAAAELEAGRIHVVDSRQLSTGGGLLALQGAKLRDEGMAAGDIADELRRLAPHSDTSFVLDTLFGDPAWLPHPVVLMGRCITALENHLRTALPKTPRGELVGGGVVAAVLPLGTLAVTGLACHLAAALHPALGLALQMFWCAQALAAKGLVQESRNVYRELVKGDLPAARRAVARIVGRDTQALTAEGVTKAAVETVAENASDGVIAPLLYMLIGGAPLALTYKAINTMDSMLGYKNEKYLYFGRIPAKLDDAANYLPSRLAALLWVAAAAFTHNDAKGAWKIWRRDRRNHASPNSAQTESACAGALGVQLAGPAYYFGEYYAKPTIGDPLRPIEPEDILRANRMMYVASAFALAWGVAIRAIL